MKNPAESGPESDSERQWQEKPTKNASGDVSGRTFSLAGPFLVDFGLPAGPQNRPKIDPEAWDRLSERRLFSSGNRFFVFSSLGRVPEGSRTDSGGSGVPPGPDFAKILRYFFAGFAGILSWFVGFRRNVAGIHRQPPELTLRGFSGVRRSRGAN